MMHGGMLQACEGGGRVRDAECAVTGSNLRVGEGVSGSSWREEANERMLHLAMGSDPVRVDMCDWDSEWGVQSLRVEVSGSSSVMGRAVSRSAGGEEAIGRMLFFLAGLEPSTSSDLQLGCIPCETGAQRKCGRARYSWDAGKRGVAVASVLCAQALRQYAGVAG